MSENGETSEADRRAAHYPHPVVAPAWVFTTSISVLKFIADKDDAPNDLRRDCSAAARLLEARLYDSDSVGDVLFDAYVAGFMNSHEGGNAEYPHAYDEDQIREEKREEFEQWCAEEWNHDDGEGDE